MKLITKNFILSPKDKLPDNIENPEELIKKITRKITINSKASNLNSTFLWINLAEKILKRYSNFNENIILDLQYNLATILLHKSDYNKAKKLLKNTIKKYHKQSNINKENLSVCYWYMAKTLRHLEDYENAYVNITYAMKYKKNSYNYYCENAEILYKLNKIKDAEENFKRALKICTMKNGNKQTSTASIMFAYGLFIASTDRIDIGIKKMYNAYSIFKNLLGNENLYTIQISANIANFLFMEKKYVDALEKQKAAYFYLKKILGDDNEQTLICKTNCAKTLIKMKQYSNSIDFLENPFVITDKKEKLLLFSYNKTIMKAPEIYIHRTGTSVFKILNIMESKNIPITKNDILVNSIINNCYQFEPVSQEYWFIIAKLLAKLNKKGKYVA